MIKKKALAMCGYRQSNEVESSNHHIPTRRKNLNVASCAFSVVIPLIASVASEGPDFGINQNFGLNYNNTHLECGLDKAAITIFPGGVSFE